MSSLLIAYDGILLGHFSRVAETTEGLFFGSLRDIIMCPRAKISSQTLTAVEVVCQLVKKISKIRILIRRIKTRFKCAKTGKPRKFGAIIKVSN